MAIAHRIPIFSMRFSSNFRISRPRGFHETKIIFTRLSPAVIRQNKALDRLRSASVRENEFDNCEESLPPINLLIQARKAGVLKHEPEKMIIFLRLFKNLDHHRQNNDCQQKLLTEFQITTPRTITILAAILRRCKSSAQQKLAKRLMLFASSIGDKIATFEIICSALRSNSISHYQKVLTRLENLARDGDQQAMMLMGKVLFYTSQSQEKSLSWLQKANYPPTGNLDFDGAGESLVLEGRILQKMGKLNEARIVFEKSAKELNDPEAYFYLSQLEKNVSLNQRAYLLKAASAGITEAWYNLGVIELDRVYKSNRVLKSLEDFGLAREWFLVAAHDGNGPSMLNLALICKLTQNVSQAFEWLEKAKNIVNVSAESERLLQEWKSTTDTSLN